MEPVNTETGREVDETDSLKVNVIFSLQPPHSVFHHMHVLVWTASSIPVWVCFCPVQFVCFPAAPYLMRCKSSVTVLSSLVLFMPSFLLPFSTASFMMPWVGVNVSWLAFHPPLCANRCSFEAVCYHFIIVLMSLTCICLSCPNVFCVCTVGMYLCSFLCMCMYWIAGFYYIFSSCVYVFFISCAYP